MAVLIVTVPNDADAQVVKLAINHLGEKCDIFYSNDYADLAEWSFNMQKATFQTSYRGRTKEWSFDDYHSVWMRRPASVVPREHLDDVRERVAAENEARSFLNSVYRIIEAGKFVVNPLTATRIGEEKLFQFKIAQAVGLPMPATLISNSPAEILSFFESYNRKIIYKTLVPMLWNIHSSAYTSVPTTLIEDPEILLTNDLRSAPGIYQEVIEKKAELRVTILGKTVLALRKQFPTRSASDLGLDWRSMHQGVEFSEDVLPEALAASCFELLRRLNLTMGCFDFAIDVNDRYYFLEVNPQGQFLWADQVCPDMNHLEAMANFLIAADPDFRYSKENRLRLAQFAERKVYQEMTAWESEHHFGNLATSKLGLVSVPLVESTPLSEEDIQRQLEDVRAA